MRERKGGKPHRETKAKRGIPVGRREAPRAGVRRDDRVRVHALGPERR